MKGDDGKRGQINHDTAPLLNPRILYIQHSIFSALLGYTAKNSPLVIQTKGLFL